MNDPHGAPAATKRRVAVSTDAVPERTIPVDVGEGETLSEALARVFEEPQADVAVDVVRWRFTLSTHASERYPEHGSRQITGRVEGTALLALTSRTQEPRTYSVVTDADPTEAMPLHVAPGESLTEALTAAVGERGHCVGVDHATGRFWFSGPNPLKGRIDGLDPPPRIQSPRRTTDRSDFNF